MVMLDPPPYRTVLGIALSTLAEMRAAWSQDYRTLDRIRIEWRRQDEQLIAALATPAHHKRMLAGLPFCSCGHSLQGGDATGTWITHRLTEVRAVLGDAPARPGI